MSESYAAPSGVAAAPPERDPPRRSHLANVPLRLGPGAGTARFFCPDGSGGSGAEGNRPEETAPSCPTFAVLFNRAGCDGGGADCIMRVKVTGESRAATISTVSPLLFADNLLPLAPPHAFNLPPSNVSAAVSLVAADGGSATIVVRSASSGVALYVWLSTLANGRFGENGFLLPPGERSVTFLPFGPLDVPKLRASLRVEHLAEYLR